jgi:glyoxylate reductase
MAKPVVFVTCRVVGDCIKRLQAGFDVLYRDNPLPAESKELLSHAREADAMICVLEDVIDANLMDACPKLRVIANVAVGFDNIDIAEATKRGILVTNTPGVLTDATADLAFALLLAVSRRIAESDRYVREGQWKAWSTDLMLGYSVQSKTLGIVGMGRIGEAVAKRGEAFGMKTIFTRRGNGERDARLHNQLGAKRVSLEELLDKSDFISVHCPLNSETKHLIGEGQFSLMKPHCIFINTARGAVVDQQALIYALQSRQIAGAGLDVFENEPDVPSELIGMANVVLLPHIGSATIETRSAMADMAADGLISVFAGAMPPNAVNGAALSGRN